MTTKEISGSDIYEFARTIFPLARSIMGNGVRETLGYVRQIIPELTILEIATGERCFDWTIPDEWNIEDAYIGRLDGTRVVDFQKNNLHVVSYSVPVNEVMSRDELLRHVHSRSDLPEAVPYVTSYYDRTWGFCVSENQRRDLTDDAYRVVIRSRLEPGSMTLGELLVPGETDEEVLVHTYTCHPSMGNNETSGVAVATFLARSILDMPRRRYSYRIVFTPETIGAVAYISRNLDTLRKRVRAGFILTCVGDDRAWSLMPSRKPGTLPERAARHILEYDLKVPYLSASYLQRGSDERQYCAPGVDLPVVSIMRSMYLTYPEYHTSLDDLSLISAEGLWGGYQATWRAIQALEANRRYRTTVLCEPQLGRRGLRPQLKNGIELAEWSRTLWQIIGHSDGQTDLMTIAELLCRPIFELVPLVERLCQENLLEPVDPHDSERNT